MKLLTMLRYFAVVFFCVIVSTLSAQNKRIVKLFAVDTAWANNSVNAVVFRKNSLVTFRDTQYIAFYNNKSFVVLGKRRLNTVKWILKTTAYKGNAADAHNTVNIMVDGEGYLHMAWDHHNNLLNYCKSIYPGSLELTGRLSMSGSEESKISYPEFYKLPGGNILIFYRNGSSGNGNLVINKYEVSNKKWTTVQNNLIDGEESRNAYWQACTDANGNIHISWVWRESPDVASNHDMCYARSRDGGITWEKSTGEKYKLPINAANAEYITRIPQKSELINQTSMVTDESGNPFIASYWRDFGDTIPQYHVIYKNSSRWKIENLGFRKTSFSLSGMGTKRVPVSRPQIIAWQTGKLLSAAIIFRDAERGDKVSVATCNGVGTGKWKIDDLTEDALGNWEPTYDTELWKTKGILNLFVEKVVQADAEGSSVTPPQLVQVLEWNPRK